MLTVKKVSDLAALKKLYDLFCGYIDAAVLTILKLFHLYQIHFVLNIYKNAAKLGRKMIQENFHKYLLLTESFLQFPMNQMNFYH